MMALFNMIRSGSIYLHYIAWFNVVNVAKDQYKAISIKGTVFQTVGYLSQMSMTRMIRISPGNRRPIKNASKS